MIKKILSTILIAFLAVASTTAQINTDQVMNVGRNAMYFEDYVLSIQYFNQVIAAKPYLARPYFLRALAKYYLEDFTGAETDVSAAIERNPFITDAYELRGVIKQNLGDAEGAISDYDKALSMLPDNRSLLFNKAMALSDLEKYQQADTAFSYLIDKYPRFEGALVGKARVRLALNDTTAAIDYADKALVADKNSTNAHLLRADIFMQRGKDYYAEALKDMDEAIRLNPKNSGYFVNRAFLRYKLDDYYGAMSDYDYAIQLSPNDFVAHYNRAMLCTEVRDFDKAITDFDEVIRIRPDEYRTLYNRAVVHRERGEYKKALADINAVINQFPTLAAAYFMRFDIKRSLGDRSAQRDLDKSLALAKQRIRIKGKKGASDTSDLFGTPTVNDNVKTSSSSADDDSESQEEVAARFSSLLTINDNLKNEQEFDNKTIRGRVQDRKINVETEPLFTLSYFISPTELKPTADYIKEVDDINRTRALRFLLMTTNHDATLNDAEMINKHFESIEYYNSYIATHAPRAIDYFGRAMDQYTVHNYEAALADLDRAVDLTPGFTLAYFMRASVKDRIAQRGNILKQEASKPAIDIRHNTTAEIISDLDKVIESAPNMAIAHYNKGTILLRASDYTSAIKSLNRAIELKPDFGEAYYNRGYAYLRLGNRTAGLADLSKAGELGVVASYNLLKRMSITH